MALGKVPSKGLPREKRRLARLASECLTLLRRASSSPLFLLRSKMVRRSLEVEGDKESTLGLRLEPTAAKSAPFWGEGFEWPGGH